MQTCCVKGCKSRSDQQIKYKSIRFFSFPKNEKYRKIWLETSRVNNINMKHARICSIHFQASCYQSSWQAPLLGFSPKTRRKLRLDAIPTEFLNISTVPSTHHTKETNNSLMERSAADIDQQKILSTGIDRNAASTSVATDCEIQSTTIQTDMEAASISVNIDLAEPSTSSKTDSVIPSSSSRIDFRHTEPLIYDNINN
ncbi:THAP domain-containing protein 2 [Formica fusca]